MKNFFICFSFLVFYSSFLFAQDTIVLNDGERIGVKISALKDEIIYTKPPDEKLWAISYSKVNYIKYADGSMYTSAANKKDTASKKWNPYILFSAGLNSPWTFSGYGASSYYSDYDGYGYSGYAKGGSDYSLTAGLKNHRGWELTGMFSYIHNPFDASGVMSETVYNFMLGTGPQINVTGVESIGGYSYNNYSVAAGIAKNWKSKDISLGFSLLFGSFITYTPAMHGIVTGSTFGNSQNTVSYYFNMDAETKSNFATEMSFHIDADFTKHLFFRLLLELQFSDLINGGGYQFTDMTTGAVIYSGHYISNGSLGWANTNLFVGLSDITCGLGYKF